MSEIIRCKDCRYWGEGLTEEQKDVVRKLPVLDLVCSWWESDGCCPDDFCSNAKPMPEEDEFFDATGYYDEVEEIPNCTVQILRNSATGETSVGWWRNE